MYGLLTLLLAETVLGSAAADRPAQGIIDTLWGTQTVKKSPATRIPSGRILRVRLATQPLTLDWTTGEYPPILATNTLRGLYQLDPKTGQPTPDLVSQAAWRKDAKTGYPILTLRVLDDAHWSDGVAFNAAQATEALRRLVDPKLASPFRPLLSSILGFETGDPQKLQVRTIDAQTLEITFKHPAPYFSALLAHPATFPIRPDLIAKDRSYGKNPLKMAFLGHYRIENWTPGIRMILRLNSKSNLERSPYLEQIQAWIIPDFRAALQLFERGHLDILTGLAVAPTQTNTSFSPVPTAALSFLYVTPSHPWTQNAQRLRRIQTALQGVAEAFPPLVHRVAQGSILPPEIGLELNPTLPAQLDLNGPIAANETAPGGTAPVLTLGYPDTPEAFTLAQWIQKKLQKDLPLTLQLRSIDSKNYSQIMRKNPLPLFLGEVTPIIWDADAYFSAFTRLSPLNLGQWKNEDYDSLVREAATRSDRKPLYQKAQDLLLGGNHPALLPLFWRTTATWMAPYIQNLQMDHAGQPDWRSARYEDPLNSDR